MLQAWADTVDRLRTSNSRPKQTRGTNGSAHQPAGATRKRSALKALAFATEVAHQNRMYNVHTHARIME